MQSFLLGMIAMGAAVVALLFLRFWRSGHDRLFLWFAGAFLLEAANRTAYVLRGARTEDETLYVLLRLLFFVLIIAAIVDKNLSSRGGADR